MSLLAVNGIMHGRKNMHVDKIDTIDTVDIDTLDTINAMDIGSDCTEGDTVNPFLLSTDVPPMYLQCTCVYLYVHVCR